MLVVLRKIVKREKGRRFKAIRKRIERDARPTTIAQTKHTIFVHEVSKDVHLFI